MHLAITKKPSRGCPTYILAVYYILDTLSKISEQISFVDNPTVV